MKKTAIEYLVEQLEKGINEEYTWHKVIEQAKAIEKEQMMDAWDNGNQWEWDSNIKNSEEYYNKTFKSE